MEYNVLFEQLVDQMTRLEGFDVPGILQTLSGLCVILRVSKGVTTFYEDPAHEQARIGEPIVCYDSGEKHELASRMRHVTAARMVITCEVYQAAGSRPWSVQERTRVEMIQRMMLMCLNRPRQEKVMERMAYLDDDGYYNLRYFYARISEMIKDGELAGKTAYRINLQHFTLVNEQFGQQAGNRIMRRYIDKLKEAGGEGGFICRLGGDNFVGVFETGKLPEVLICLEGLPIETGEEDGRRVNIGAMAGLCRIESTRDIPVPGRLMERIVIPFTVAKRKEAGRIVFYEKSMQEQRIMELSVQKDFARALQRREFTAYYQPKVDITTGKVIGAEALCRWIRDGRMIMPAEFIPVLERGYDICKLDFYMLDQVCRDIRRWLEEGREAVRVSINFSRRHITNPDLFDQIVEIVDRYQIPHEYIEIELTETTTDVEFKALRKTVSGLQEAGFSASVDDFGVGYSSLNLIKVIPWNILKLDKSILPTAGGNIERESKMFAHVIAMAHEIGVICVAEGVETREQLHIMYRYGCRLAQGFLFDKPLPAADFESRLMLGRYDIAPFAEGDADQV